MMEADSGAVGDFRLTLGDQQLEEVPEEAEGAGRPPCSQNGGRPIVQGHRVEGFLVVPKDCLVHGSAFHHGHTVPDDLPGHFQNHFGGYADQRAIHRPQPGDVVRHLYLCIGFGQRLCCHLGTSHDPDHLQVRGLPQGLDTGLAQLAEADDGESGPLHASLRLTIRAIRPGRCSSRSS